MRKETLGAVVMIALAWALWRHSTSHSGYSSWEIVGAYGEKNICDEKLKEAVTAEAGKKRFRKDNPFMTSHFSLNHRRIYHKYSCLPSDLDPGSEK